MLVPLMFSLDLCRSPLGLCTLGLEPRAFERLLEHRLLPPSPVAACGRRARGRSRLHICEHRRVPRHMHAQRSGAVDAIRSDELEAQPVHPSARGARA